MTFKCKEWAINHRTPAQYALKIKFNLHSTTHANLQLQFGKIIDVNPYRTNVENMVSS